MQGKRRESPSGHQSTTLIVVDGSLTTNSIVDILHVKVKRLVDLVLFLGDGENRVHETRYKNFTVRSDEFLHEMDEIGHGFVNNATKHSRMQVLFNSSNVQMEVGYPTETISKTWFLSSQPIVITDCDAVCPAEELLSFSKDKVI